MGKLVRWCNNIKDPKTSSWTIKTSKRLMSVLSHRQKNDISILQKKNSTFWTRYLFHCYNGHLYKNLQKLLFFSIFILLQSLTTAAEPSIWFFESNTEPWTRLFVTKKKKIFVIVPFIVVPFFLELLLFPCLKILNSVKIWHLFKKLNHCWSLKNFHFVRKITCEIFSLSKKEGDDAILNFFLFGPTC